MARKLQRFFMAVLFVLAGVNHFVMPQLYMSIMPDYLPRPRLLVLMSGVAEILGGLLLLIPRLRAAARWSLTALLVAVFPANLHMALHAERYSSIATWLLWVRLPLQGVFIWWVWWVTKDQGE